jgi:hypothetical protein
MSVIISLPTSKNFVHGPLLLAETVTIVAFLAVLHTSNNHCAPSRLTMQVINTELGASQDWRGQRTGAWFIPKQLMVPSH